jgi:hypothetical protein
VIIETYMEGPEYSLDALLYDGTLTICGVADRHIHFPPYFIEMGHTLPAALSPADRYRLCLVLAEGAAALGLTHGAVKGDLKLTRDGPMVGEIAARLSGGYMSGWTFPYASGCPLTQEALLLALGKKPAYLEAHRRPLVPPPGYSGPISPFALYEISPTGTSAERAWISIPGRVLDVLGQDTAVALPLVRDFLPRSKPGDRVSFPRNNVEKCGNVIASSVEAAEKAVAAMTVILEPGDPATAVFLAGEGSIHEEGFPPWAFDLQGFHYGGGKLPPLPADMPIGERIPPMFAPFLDTARDWNHLSLREAIERFDRLRPRHPALDSLPFWSACIRGSIQGMCFLADTAAAEAAP